MERRHLAAAACVCLTLAACGEAATERAARAPAAPPRVVLSDADRRLWAREPATRAETVPVLLYRRLGPEAFARHMTLLDHAGYETIALDQLVRFVAGQAVSLPPRPILVTFDGGLLATWRESDGILRALGLKAVLFVSAGHAEEGERAYLGWGELARLQRSGRWDVQLQAGTGDYEIRYGPDPGDVGPFYAYRGAEEVLGGWRERVFSDLSYGEQQLAHHIEQYRPLAVAPPYGNFGQAGTNDPRIPRQLLTRLQSSFPLVFTQDRHGHAAPGAPNPLGRIEVGPETTEADLRALLESPPSP